MKNLFTLGLLVLVVILGLNQDTYADCTLIMPNGSGNDIECPAPVQNTPLNTGSMPATTTGDDMVIVLPGGGVVLPGAGSAISTSGGEDTIIVNSGAVISGTNGIISGSETPPMGDFISISGGTVSSLLGMADDAIGAQAGDDVLEISGGTINGEIDMGSDSDTVRVSGGTINGVINTSVQSDTVIISGGTYNPPGATTISTQSSNDLIEITADVDLAGRISCGSGDEDRLIFSMPVPEAEIPALSQAFIDADQVFDDLTVNGIFYEWNTCEIRIPNFQPIITTITLAPLEATNELNEDHTVTATVLTEGDPESGVNVTFEVINGPNQGLSDSDTTNANGEATFTYTSTTTGTDTIVASYDDPDLGAKASNAVTKTWILTRNVPTLSEWGLIAMAGILGIVGFMVIRRRKAAA